MSGFNGGGNSAQGFVSQPASSRSQGVNNNYNVGGNGGGGGSGRGMKRVGGDGSGGRGEGGGNKKRNRNRNRNKNNANAPKNGNGNGDGSGKGNVGGSSSNNASNDRIPRMPTRESTTPTPPPANAPLTSTQKQHQTTTPFSGLNVNPLVKSAIRDVLKYEYMTEVQAATISLIVDSRNDCLAKAKTGTGKTIAFLIPALEVLLSGQNNRFNPTPRRSPTVLVLSPTRELAAQIAVEGRQLASNLRGFEIVSVVGGTNINTDKNRISRGVDILVATPGRMIDHLEVREACESSCHH